MNFDRLLFGTAGTPQSAKPRDTISGFKRLRELGLDAMEIEYVRGTFPGEKKAVAIAAAAKENNLRLTAHGPYFINLNAVEQDKVDASRERIIKTAHFGSLSGAESITFHAGFYLGQDTEKAVRIVLTADYLPGDATLTGYFYDDAEKTPATFYPFGVGIGVGRGSDVPVGQSTWAWAAYVYNPDILGYGWSVLAGDFSDVLEARPDALIEDGDAGTISLWWANAGEGEPMVDSGHDATAVNPLGRTVVSNEKLVVRWSRLDGFWSIIACEISGRPASMCRTIEWVRTSASSSTTPAVTTGMPLTSTYFA